MSAPFPKWVYDIVMEMLHCDSTGTPIDSKSVLAAVPDGMKYACQGVMDYYVLAGAVMPVASTPEGPTAPAEAPMATPAVISLSDLGINMPPAAVPVMPRDTVTPA